MKGNFKYQNILIVYLVLRPGGSSFSVQIMQRVFHLVKISHLTAAPLNIKPFELNLGGVSSFCFGTAVREIWYFLLRTSDKDSDVLPSDAPETAPFPRLWLCRPPTFIFRSAWANSFSHTCLTESFIHTHSRLSAHSEGNEVLIQARRSTAVGHGLLCWMCSSVFLFLCSWFRPRFPDFSCPV